MATDASAIDSRLAIPKRFPIYYGWVQVAVAGIAMTATLPGRTHGLGLITEPLLQDLHFDRIVFANLNLAATVLGAGMGALAGWAVDRFGTRKITVITGLALALAVFGLTRSAGIVTFLLALTLIRGFGQSALSVVSLAIIGKWFVRRLGLAMALFAILLTIGFIGTVLGIGYSVQASAGPVTGDPPLYAHPEGWRPVWDGIGWFLMIGFVPTAWILVRDTPESCGLAPDAPSDKAELAEVKSHTFPQAIRTPAFWVFVATTALFNLVWSGVTLFNESILAERGFRPELAVQCLAIVTAGGIVANVVAGALARRRAMGFLLGLGMGILAIALGCFPWITTDGELVCYAAAVGMAGGVVTVVYFAVWGHLFGRLHLGRIQGATQVICTLASAAGPLILAASQSRLNSYSPALIGLAIISAILALASIFVPLPKQTT